MGVNYPSFMKTLLIWSSNLHAILAGCPFRHTDLDLLKQKLKAMSIGTVYYDKVCMFCVASIKIKAL